MFTELREALAGGQGNRRGEGKHSTDPFERQYSPWGSIRIRGQRSPAGVTPKAKRQKKALVKRKRWEISEDLSQRELCFSDMMINNNNNNNNLYLHLFNYERYILN